MTNHVVDRQTRDERARVVIDTCDVILRALRGEPQRREVTDRRILRGWGERAVVGRRAATEPGQDRARSNAAARGDNVTTKMTTTCDGPDCSEIAHSAAPASWWTIKPPWPQATWEGDTSHRIRHFHNLRCLAAWASDMIRAWRLEPTERKAKPR